MMGSVGYLIEVPVDGGGRLLVQATDDELPGSLELAALRPGHVVARAGESLEQALDEVKPALRAVAGRLRAMAPDELTVEFGIVLGAETGVVVAKGSADVHFTVSLTWRRPEEAAAVPGDDPGVAREAELA
jgi:Trypsin-co-occurring domain 1